MCVEWRLCGGKLQQQVTLIVATITTQIYVVRWWPSLSQTITTMLWRFKVMNIIQLGSDVYHTVYCMEIFTCLKLLMLWHWCLRCWWCQVLTQWYNLPEQQSRDPGGHYWGWWCSLLPDWPNCLLPTSFYWLLETFHRQLVLSQWN